jgi:hypothetical protein
MKATFPKNVPSPKMMGTSVISTPEVCICVIFINKNGGVTVTQTFLLFHSQHVSSQTDHHHVISEKYTIDDRIHIELQC